jgi:AcrR family transcriptional regulator
VWHVYNVHMPYHHGQLREALVDAGLETARADGPEAVVLRAATRAAGVTPNAAYRHFADREELLGAVAASCIVLLAELVEKRLAELDPETDPVEHTWQRLMVAGHAYVEFALTEPGWFKTAFGSNHPDEASIPFEHNPFAILSGILDELVEVGALPAERRPGAEYAAWSAVHGISTLIIDGPLADLPSEERDAAVEKVLSTVVTGL